MNITKMEYKMEKFNEENVEIMLKSLGFDAKNYIITMTKPTLLNLALIGNVAQFSSRYCIICFSETELKLIMISRTNSKNVTELIKIDCNEIKKIKMSDILISYMLKIKTSEATMKFQVFKRVGKFTRLKNSLETFKELYSL